MFNAFVTVLTAKN